MKILERDHLTLTLKEPRNKLKYIELIMEALDAFLKAIENAKPNEAGLVPLEEDVIIFNPLAANILAKITESLPDITSLTEATCKYNFLICNSVFQAAELIKIGKTFTGRTFKDIRPGTYGYLLGKKEALKFEAGPVGIQGLYYNGEIAFHFYVDTDTGEYYFPPKYEKEFTRLIKIIIFVELGDIEIVELLAGRSNGLNKKEGKVVNDTKNTVYVVDSSWNKILVRTEGFAVRGHFKLQPCGKNSADRKLIWVNAFEKTGYTRSPRAQIIK